MSNKRIQDPETASGRKRRRTDEVHLGTSSFLDLEAAEYDDSEYSAEEDGVHTLNSFIDDSTVPQPSDGSSLPTASTSVDETRSIHPRLQSVIARYEARRTARETDGNEARNLGEQVDNESLEMQQSLDEQIIESVGRLPHDADIGLWRVRVQEGRELESFDLIRDRLRARPRYAASVVCPAGSRSWVLIESNLREYVEKLSINLSTVDHPLDISFVPPEERLEWIHWRPKPHRIKAPCWVRLRKASVLNEKNVAPYVRHYAGDLAFVRDSHKWPMVEICLVPRMPYLIARPSKTNPEEKVVIKTVRLPRLVHPDLIGHQEPNLDKVHTLNTDIYWIPDHCYPLRMTAPGVCQFVDKRHKNQFRLPFAIALIPNDALDIEDPHPSLKELNTFSEGMAIGAEQLDFLPPSTEFLRWTYEYYVGAALEIDHKVEVLVTSGIVRGVVVDVRFNEVVVSEQGTWEEITVDIRDVRRYYDVGDEVKVCAASSPESKKEGWVLSIENDQVTILSRTKEEFVVKSWQLGPCDGHQWASPPVLQTNDTVTVICPISSFYGKKGRVVQVGVASIGVIAHQSNEMFYVPPWFLEADKALPGVRSVAAAPDNKEESRQGIHYDRYRELVNTHVVVCGQHHDKGLFGRVREHLGNQVLRVEMQSGSRMVDIHVNFLLSMYSTGRDVRLYHVGSRRADTRIYQPRSLTPPDLERPTTPMPPERPEPEVEDESTISYDGRTYSASWMLKDGLITKRIWARVRNTTPDPFTPGSGFDKGFLDGEKALILSGASPDAIRVNIAQREMKIPSKYLFPEHPSSQGQFVVPLTGVHVGDVFKTRKQEAGLFLLVRRGHKGASQFVFEGTWLAVCDPR